MKREDEVIIDVIKRELMDERRFLVDEGALRPEAFTEMDCFRLASYIWKAVESARAEWIIKSLEDNVSSGEGDEE